MIYYHIATDTIFESGYLDAHFFGLVFGIDWDQLEVLGEL